MDSAYDLFQAGTRLLEDGDFHAAAVPLARARDLEPDKASIREALGRALFGVAALREAAEEFEARRRPRADERLRALLPRARLLQLMGRHAEARRPLALACNLRPERADYREYRDRARRRRGLTQPPEAPSHPAARRRSVLS